MRKSVWEAREGSDAVPPANANVPAGYSQPPDLLLSREFGNAHVRRIDEIENGPLVRDRYLSQKICDIVDFGG